MTRYFSIDSKPPPTMLQQRVAISTKAQTVMVGALHYPSDSSTREQSTKRSDMISTVLRKSSESSQSVPDDDEVSAAAARHFKALPPSLQVNVDSSPRTDSCVVQRSAEVDIPSKSPVQNAAYDCGHNSPRSNAWTSVNSEIIPHANPLQSGLQLIAAPQTRQPTRRPAESFAKGATDENRDAASTRYKYIASPATVSQSPFAFDRPSYSKKVATAMMVTSLGQPSLSVLRSETEPSSSPSKINTSGRDLDPASRVPSAHDVIQDQDEGQSEDDGELVVIQPAHNGKWYCPIQDCEKSLHGYSEGGLRSHLKGVMHRMQPTTVGGVGKRRQVQLNAQAIGGVPAQLMVKPIPKPASVAAADPEDLSSAQAPSSGTSLSVSNAPSLYPSPASQPRVNATDSCPPKPPMINNGVVKADKAEISTSAPSIEPGDPKSAQRKGVLGTVEAAAINGENGATSPQRLIIRTASDDRSGNADLIQALGEDVSNGIISAMNTGTSIPDRQDSRAFSTWTFNQSTQAAMLDAGRAFQETQTVDRVEEWPNFPDRHLAVDEVPLERPSAITPFRILNRVSAKDEMAFNFAPESTQQLLNEAEAIGAFSTVKKRRQPDAPKQTHISWGVSKPSSQTDMTMDPSMLNTTPILSKNTSQPLQTEGIKLYSIAQLSAHRSIPSSKPQVPNSYPFPSRRSDLAGSFQDQEENPKALPFQSTATSMQTPTLSQFLTASAPTPMPVASYQQGQNINDSRGLFRSRSTATEKDDCSVGSQDVDANLDAFDEFLRSGDVDGDIKTVERERRRSGLVAINS
jgi:hypothetical protein